MRDLKRNTQPVFFKLYEGDEPIIDQFGNPTGSYYPKYSGLHCALLCVSPNKGSSERNMFGTLTEYDRTMTTADTGCPIDERSVLWVDGVGTDGPWNYVVRKRAPWKNSVGYAISEVEISIARAEQEQMQEQMQEQLRAARLRAEGGAADA